jgi:hypothetical protein
VIPSWYRRVIQEGDTGPDVQIVRRKLGLHPDGPFDRTVIERIKGLMPKDKTEVLDEVIAELLGETAATAAGVAPEWFTRPLERHDVGEDVRVLRQRLGVADDNRFEHDCEDAVRRFQSARDLPLTGKVDEELALLIGD